MDTVTALMAEQARRRPDAPAIFYGDEIVTFGQLHEQSRRVARGLSALGVGPADRVAMWLPNSPAYLALYLACCRLGAIAVAVNTRFRSHEVGDIVGRSGAKVLAMWPGFRAIDFLGILSEIDPAALDRIDTIILYDEGQETAAVPAALEHCRRVDYGDLASQPAFAGDHASPDTGCNIFTTSGTTRAPKFVLHNQAGISRHARIVARTFGYTGGEGALLQALPFCGVFGFTQGMASLASGHPMLLYNAFDAGETVRRIDQHNVQHMNATDDMLEAMLQVDKREHALPTIKYCGFASFNTNPDEIIEKAERRNLTLVGLYGMSEVQAFFARQPVDAPMARRKLGGGLPVAPEARVRVRHVETGAVCPHGETGEIELTGPSQMSGYYGNAAATAETVLDDGFIRTGDMGYTTDDGGFVYLSRMGDVLRLGGFLVSPVEIETFIQEHPGVTGCQVVGAQTSAGPRAVGFVTVADDASFDEEAIRRHCLDGLAKFKAPARIFPLDDFPTTKSANGTKIQRAKLRQMAESFLAERPDP